MSSDLVITRLFDAPRALVYRAFADEDGKTRLTVTQGPYSPEIMGGAKEGWESSFTKLDALLAA